jgi:hypothetical protein
MKVLPQKYLSLYRSSLDVATAIFDFFINTINSSDFILARDAAISASTRFVSASEILVSALTIFFLNSSV